MDEIEAALHVANRNRFNPPKSDDEISTLVTDITGRYTPREAPWPQPRSLRPDPLPPMPLTGVPVDLRNYVEAVATAYQVPRDLALLTVLRALGVACQGTAVVGMGPGWLEELAMFTMSVAGSGERKSPVVAEVVAPVEEHERE